MIKCSSQVGFTRAINLKVFKIECKIESGKLLNCKISELCDAVSEITFMP